jgi:WD40 repeat protein
LQVYSLDWTSEKNRIVSASQDGRLIVWNALTSQKTHCIKLPCAWVMTCAFSPTGQSVACGGLDSVCSIFNLNSPTDKDGNLPVSRMLSGHKGYVSSCQYVPDEDTHLITSSGDQTCVLWDITTGLRTSVFGGEFQSGHTADVLRYRWFLNCGKANLCISLFAHIFFLVIKEKWEVCFNKSLALWIWNIMLQLIVSNLHIGNVQIHQWISLIYILVSTFQFKPFDLKIQVIITL